MSRWSRRPSTRVVPEALYQRSKQSVLGASYLAACYAGDAEMVACYREAFDAGELLDAIASQVLILARRVAVIEGLTMTQLGDAMVGAAQLNVRTGYAEGA